MTVPGFQFRGIVDAVEIAQHLDRHLRRASNGKEGFSLADRVRAVQRRNVAALTRNKARHKVCTIRPGIGKTSVYVRLPW